MASLDLDTLTHWLADNDVRLRPPASPQALNALRASYQGVIHPDLIRLYQAFDGCDRGDFEADSFFSIWPIAEGLAYAKERGLSRHFAFGDVDFSADVVLCALLDPDAPVRWRDGILPPAPTFGAFFDTLMAGRLWSA
jgi:hypothetical protein